MKKGALFPPWGHIAPPPRAPVLRSGLFGSSFVSPSHWGDWVFGGTGLQPPQRKACLYEICFHTFLPHLSPPSPAHGGLFGGFGCHSSHLPLPRISGVSAHCLFPSLGNRIKSFSYQWIFLSLILSRFLLPPLYQDTFFKNDSSLSCAHQIQVFEIN